MAKPLSIVQEIKYKLALLREESDTGIKSEIKINESFKNSFKSQKHFMGWINFEKTWYIDIENDPWKVVPLKRPLVEEWHDVLREFVPIITPEGEIVTPEEWEKRNGGESNIQ
jgi:hypothetical protein